MWILIERFRLNKCAACRRESVIEVVWLSDGNIPDVEDSRTSLRILQANTNLKEQVTNRSSTAKKKMVWRNRLHGKNKISAIKTYTVPVWYPAGPRYRDKKAPNSTWGVHSYCSTLRLNNEGLQGRAMSREHKGCYPGWNHDQYAHQKHGPRWCVTKWIPWAAQTWRGRTAGSIRAG